MSRLHLLLVMVSFICFALAVTNWVTPKLNLIALGLATWVLTLIL